MTSDLFTKLILRAARRMSITKLEDLAMMMAMAEQESFHGGNPTMLAVNYHNLFGFKWSPTDSARYEKIDFPPNKFEVGMGRTDWVSYRCYDSFEHCIENWNWHRVMSTHYKAAFDQWRATGDYRGWIRAIGLVWDDTNPHHADQLVQRYDRWIDKLSEG